MKRYWLVALGVLVVAALWAGAYFLTVGKRASSPSYGGMENQPGASASRETMREQFAQFQESHRDTFRLTGLADNIRRLDAEAGAHPLTPAQARDVLAVLRPLRAQEALTQDQAREATKGLQRALTDEQRAEISAMTPERRFGGPGQQGNRPRQGQGPRQGQRPRFDPGAMEDFNPFNPKGENPMATRSKERWDAWFAALEKKAAK